MNFVCKDRVRLSPRVFRSVVGVVNWRGPSVGEPMAIRTRKRSRLRPTRVTFRRLSREKGRMGRDGNESAFYEFGEVKWRGGHFRGIEMDVNGLCWLYCRPWKVGILYNYICSNTHILIYSSNANLTLLNMGLFFLIAAAILTNNQITLSSV